MIEMTEAELKQIRLALHNRMDFLKQSQTDIYMGVIDESESVSVAEQLDSVVSAMHKLGATYAKR